MKLKRVALLCGVLATLLVPVIQPTVTYACAHCEDMMEEAVISCLQNGGGDWCWTAGKYVYCQCEMNECGGQQPNGCTLQ